MPVYLAPHRYDTQDTLLYICIPAHNEAETIGVMLWRIRKVFQAYSREYEILVYDDASADGTAEVLAPYAEVAPLTVLRGDRRKGYGASLETLAREVSRRSKYPRRDGMIVMQGDFTDQPENLPELIKRFEGGADIVFAERGTASDPVPVRRLRKLVPWALRFSLPVKGVADPCASFRLYRISLLRELIKTSGDKPLITTTGSAANIELLLGVMPLARRVESVALEPRYDLRMRASRVRPFAEAMEIFRLGRSARGRQITAPVAQAAEKPAESKRPSQRERATS